MGKKTSIAWTDHSFNFWWGCTNVSPGCDGCYAEAFANRLGMDIFGSGKERRYFGDKHWKEPLVWDKQAREKGETRKVFCNSMSDFFDNEVDQAVRDRAWKLIRSTHNLIWIILTKRIGNVKAMLPADWDDDYGSFYRHVWLVATVVNQEEADRDIPKLIAAAPAKVRGVSYEPALGYIDFRNHLGLLDLKTGSVKPSRLNWIIVGGESNQGKHRARPFNLKWARDVILMCKAAGVACFIKQLGSNPVESPVYHPAFEGGRLAGREISQRFWKFKDGSGANLSEWPDDLKVREFPK